ncbi:hypothetical protein NDU88_002802 [Pleurodeles waltl]|uniref:Uncharacterized protein n=1 Tax=Pleurodeles waltl TaxID=8319 RepID=A0AAV7QDX2_PLEWA|nr:hypothetical protein NDU88_002802 [Pleurodeles waltl]
MARASVGAPKFLLLSPRGTSGDKGDEGGESRSGPGPGDAAPFLTAAGSRTQAPPRLAPATRDRGRRAHPAPSQVPKMQLEEWCQRKKQFHGETAGSQCFP